MEYDIKQIAPDVWRVDVAGAVRIIRYRLDSRTFVGHLRCRRAEALGIRFA